jgi:hypothetical protein
MPVPFDPAKPDLGNVRRILFDFMRASPGSNVFELDRDGQRYNAFIQYPPENHQGKMLANSMLEVLWGTCDRGRQCPRGAMRRI